MLPFITFTQKVHSPNIVIFHSDFFIVYFSGTGTGCEIKTSMSSDKVEEMFPIDNTGQSFVGRLNYAIFVLIR